MKYKHVNNTISTSAVSAFKRHLWYLTPDHVIFSLFGDAIPENELRSLANALIEIKPDILPAIPIHRYGSGFGKPIFPELTETTTLSDLINEDSWFTAHLLKLDMSFLIEDVNMWKENNNFKSAKIIVEKLNNVNDPAERAVKLTSDFVSSSRDEEHFQNILQVVESDRKTRPNLSKLAKMH